MIHSIHLLSVFPKRFVCHADTGRAAQITARLLAERHPGMTFGYDEGPDCRHDDCHPSIRDSALSFEVQHLVAAEMILEAAANPMGLPKWCAFQYRNGGVEAHPDHDLRAVEMCRRDFDVVGERAIFARQPTPAEVLDRFRDAAGTTA
ncbi:hypothetical protein LX81_02966 [Palleronia aestuarii]|uniref:Uncharacterized protein n=1 Tax=Palleronia aestuarii TaxID=568105 RepID=A0A2W7N7D8_9RHOB|nr:hypothetical protein [Palleronia aestuarii]PZX14167.1 hypothetical protein LX81_02966 [Palleronia aestuarii]